MLGRLKYFVVIVKMDVGKGSKIKRYLFFFFNYENKNVEEEVGILDE